MKPLRFSLKRSTIPNAGRGLFTRAIILKGTAFKVQGVLMRRGSLEDRCTQYADAYKFRVGTYVLMPIGYGGFVNHSSTPNLEKIIKGKTVCLKAMRSIQAGEELFFCYSRYAQERFLRKPNR